MSRDEILKQVTEVFRDIFDEENLCITDETSAADIEEWDSLEHINLIVTIEKKFGMKFKMGEVNSMRNVGEMLDIIESRI